MKEFLAVSFMIYLIIGFIVGLWTILQMQLQARKRGIQDVSQEIFGIPYNQGENCTTPMSFYVFPVLFCLFFWPFILRGENDKKG